MMLESATFIARPLKKADPNSLLRLDVTQGKRLRGTRASIIPVDIGKFPEFDKAKGKSTR